MSPSTQQLVLVGSYAVEDQPGLYTFTFDETSGALTPHNSFAGVANPTFLVVHPNQQWLYAVSETGQASEGTGGSVCALRFDPDSGSMEAANQQPSGGDHPCHLRLDQSGKWLLVSNYGSGSVGVLPIREDGTLGEMTDHVQHEGRGTHPERQKGPHAHSTIVSPDGRYAIAADLGIDQLIIYKLDSTGGKLSPHSRTDTRPGAGPRHLVFHPGGRHLYAANELDNTVAVYDYDTANGTLREQQTAYTLPQGSFKNQVADIHISPSGKRLYVSNRGHESIAVFDVGPEGRLERVAVRPCGGKWPRNFALAPGGRFMLVANQYSDTVSVLPLLAGSDAIGEAVTQVSVAQASCVQVVQVNE